jgi:lysozyme family protein
VDKKIFRPYVASAIRRKLLGTTQAEDLKERMGGKMWSWIKKKFKKNSAPARTEEEFSFPDFKSLWGSCSIDPNRIRDIEAVANSIRMNMPKYIIVEAKTGIPWRLVGALHYRESSLSFKKCLHNGDPLPGPTIHEPKGRGPFRDWEASAIDAIMMKEKLFPEVWSPEECMRFAERFNGLGYRRHGIYSPYVWAGTNHSSEIGKYVSDGKFSSSAPEKQLGVAAIYKYMLPPSQY